MLRRKNEENLPENKENLPENDWFWQIVPEVPGALPVFSVDLVRGNGWKIPLLQNNVGKINS